MTNKGKSPPPKKKEKRKPSISKDSNLHSAVCIGFAANVAVENHRDAYRPLHGSDVVPVRVTHELPALFLLREIEGADKNTKWGRHTHTKRRERE